MVSFGGWEMPLEYTSLTEEHLAVRTRAGLFDVSHMGEIEIAGPAALAAVQHITSNDASRLKIGQAQYSALTTDAGTFVDDLLVYRLAEDHFLMVVNAANTGKDYRWIAEHIKGAGDASAVDTSARYALLAVQGPAALSVVRQLTSIDVAGLRHYWFAAGEVAGVLATVSRTGYTGEDGLEIFVPPQAATRVWDAMLDAGRDVGLVPAGLGARDTLRLEAAMRLYGSDIDDTTTVLEADLGWMIGWDKPDFVGHAALWQQRSDGPARKLVGFELLERGIARHGHEVWRQGTRIGHVTSGTQTPFLKKAIGMAYVPAEHAAPGSEIEIDLRGRRAKASVVAMPFYRRQRS